MAPTSENGLSPPRLTRWQLSLRQILILFLATTIVLALFDWRHWHISSAVVLVAFVAAMVLSRSKVRNTLLLILICTYSPYCWLLNDNPWDDYRWGWVGMWPILPGLLPAAYFLHAINDDLEFGAMALGALVYISLATIIAVRGKWLLASTALLVLALSVANSFLAYALFRA